MVEGAKRQHNSNKRLFERALEAGSAGEELHVSVSDAMWALSHVSFFSVSHWQEQSHQKLVVFASF